jgi:hypothetical protein
MAEGRLLVTPMRRWRDNIKVDRREFVLEGVWIVYVCLRIGTGGEVFLNTVMNFRVQ